MEKVTASIAHDHHSHSHGHEHEHEHEHQDQSKHHSSSSNNMIEDHGHTHEHMEHPGLFQNRELGQKRDYAERSFTVGIGGPVGSGKTALMLALCKTFRDDHSVAAVTNDIFTREDAEFLERNEALSNDRIRAIETGGCPHAAIREDISANLQACEDLTALHKTDIIFLESGGDNLAANYSRELADYTIYVIDVAGGDKVPRKGGPGITQSDLLVINKIDLADAVGADLEVMKRESAMMRGDGPTILAKVKFDEGVADIKNEILASLEKCQHEEQRGKKLKT